jgi:predicted nuclease with TOPRIM domain
MTTYQERAARLIEVEAAIAGEQAEIKRLETERGRLDEQLNAATSRAKDFGALAAARVKRDVVEVEIAEARDRLPYLEEERRELRHLVSQHENRIREAQRTLEELRGAFSNPNVFKQGFMGHRDEIFRLHQKAIIAAMLLRQNGEDVPREIVLTVRLDDMQQPEPAPEPAPARDIPSVLVGGFDPDEEDGGFIEDEDE